MGQIQRRGVPAQALLAQLRAVGAEAQAAVVVAEKQTQPCFCLGVKMLHSLISAAGSHWFFSAWKFLGYV